MSKMTFDRTESFSVELNNFTFNKEALKKLIGQCNYEGPRFQYVVRVKRHKKKRIDKKWRKTYGYFLVEKDWEGTILDVTWLIRNDILKKRWRKYDLA